MLKKTISWLLILALLCSCCMLSVFATEPTSDEEAKAQGYHFKVTASDGTVTYGKFNETVAADGARDGAFANVASGSTITLLTNATIERELHLNGVYTIDGAGKTLNARLRSDSGSANVTVKNVTFDVTLTTSNGYFYQLNAGNKCVFENCTFDIDGEPGAGLFVQRGDLTIADSSFTYTTSSRKPVFFQEDALKEAKLPNTTFNLDNATNAKIGLPAGVNGTYYRYLKNAMDNAKAGNTIYLLEDYASTANDRDRLYIDKQVTVDGNGHTVTANYPGYAVRVNGNIKGVVIRNLNIVQNGEGAALQMNAGSSATIEKSVIQCTGKTDRVMVMRGSLVLGSGTKVLGGDTEKNLVANGFRMDNSDANMTIQSGVEINVSGKLYEVEGTVKVNGGSFTVGGKVLFREPTAAEFQNTEASIYMPSGNVATKNNSGIQFTTKVDKNWYDAITAMEGRDNQQHGHADCPEELCRRGKRRVHQGSD